MKATGLKLFGFGLAVICLSLATQSPAAKGGDKGKPDKPGGEDPEPELPFKYQRVGVEPPAGNWDNGLATIMSFSINDSGGVAGWYDIGPSDANWGRDYSFRTTPDTTGGIITYPTNNLITLSTNVPIPISRIVKWINNNNQVIGGYITPSTPNWYERAALWLEDGTLIDLNIGSEGIDSHAYAINDAGQIIVWTGSSYGIIHPEEGDGKTWFKDDYAPKGVNDLLYLLPSDLGHPCAINEDGQIVFDAGYILNPDYSSTINPWIVDNNGDGSNDCLRVLSPLAETVAAYDNNDHGQIVGSIDGRAVIWEFVDGIEMVTDLGQLSRHSSDLYAFAINNTGRILGGCREKKEDLGFIFHEGQMYPLRDLMIDGSNPSWLEDINNEGWIVGFGGVYIPVDSEQ